MKLLDSLLKNLCMKLLGNLTIWRAVVD